jgi:hypothetical protein
MANGSWKPIDSGSLPDGQFRGGAAWSSAADRPEWLSTMAETVDVCFRAGVVRRPGIRQIVRDAKLNYRFSR